MGQWTSTAGPRQTKECNQAIRDLQWRGKTRIELTDFGSRELVSMCDEPSDDVLAMCDALGERFNWTITRENFREVIAAFEEATAAVVLPVDDNRTTPEQRDKRAEAAQQREAAAEMKAAEVARIAAELRVKYPWAIAADGKMSGQARAAKNLRRELAEAFPGVKFSVMSESFSMGDAVDVAWVDGPTSAEVEKISGKYQDSSFDGMDDSTSYDSSAMGQAVEIVLSRAKYCHANRSISPALYEVVGRALCEAQHVAYEGEYTRNLYGEGDRESLGHHARQLIWSTSIPVGATVTGVEDAPAGVYSASPYRLTFAMPVAAPVAIDSPPVKAIGATIEKHWHTKREFDMWIVIPAARMERPEFETFRTLCEVAGGWYSRAWGKTPGGFAFKSESVAVQFSAAFATASPAASPPPSATTATPAAPSGFGAKLRSLAESMDSPIADKLRDMSQNWTPKRGLEYAARRHEGNNLQAAQRAMMLLADAHDAGTCPPILADIRTKKEIVDLTRTRVDTSGGYYSFVDTGELSDKGPKAAALRKFAESAKSAADIAADAERARVELIQRKIDDLRGIKIEGFFPTPSGVVAEMIDEADIRDGQTILEPEAGTGSIADAIKSAADVELRCVEVRPSLCDILTLKGHDVLQGDFMETANVAGWEFDRVLMNPPFERGQDVAHVRHAFGMLKPGGRLVALVADSAAFRNGFSTWLDAVGGTSRQLPPKSFDTADAFNRTGVNVRLVTIDKPE